MIFKTIDSSVDDTRKTLALFNKDWNTYKRNWQNANGVFGKIGSVFTPANTITKSDIEAIKAYNSQIDSCVTSQTAFNRTMLNASPAAQDLVASYNGGKVSAQSMTAAQDTAKTSTVGLTIAQTALNTAISMGIGLVISYAIKSISKLINYQQDLIDKSKEAISVFEESRNALTNNKQTINDISSEYTKLAQGVDNLGRNVSLNAEDYARYNEIVNKIADMFPQMVQGYTDEGNAIIANKGNVKELTKAYEEQKQAYQDLIITKSADTYAGYKAKVIETPWTETIKGENGTYAYIEQKKYIDELIKSLEEGKEAFEDFYSNQYIKNSDIYNVLNSATKSAGVDWGGVMNIDERYEYMVENQLGNLRSYQRTLVSNINTETSKIKPIMSAYMEQSLDYQSLDSNIQDVVKQIVGQFDSEFYAQFDDATEMASYVTDNIVNKFQGIDGQKISEAFENSIDLKAKLQNGEISLDDYLSSVNEFKILIDGFDDNTKKSVDLIFNVNSSNGLSADTLINNVKSKLEDEFDNKVGELTLDELQIAAEQIEVSEGTLLSWDELIAKIQEARDIGSKNSVTFDITNYKDQIDDVQSATSTLLSALSDLNAGKLDESAVIDLMQEFPELIPYIDMASDGFGDLSNGLQTAINQNVGSLVQELETLRLSLDTDEERAQVDALISSLQGLSTVNISTYKDTISDVQSSISTLRSALDSLNSGDLTEIEVVDLMQQFPDLVPYIDLTADGFGNLSAGLSELIAQQPTALIQSLEELKESLTTDEERVQVDLLIDSLQRLSSYGDTGMEAYATTIGATWSDTANVIEGVTAQFENLAKVQEAVSNGLTMSATAAAELAKMYPEILTNAEFSANGQITLNEAVVKSILDGDNSIISAQIAKLEADKAELTSKKTFAEAQLNIARQIGEGEGKRYCPLPQ